MLKLKALGDLLLKLINLKKPLIHEVSLKRQFFLSLCEKQDYTYKVYLEKIDKFKFCDLGVIQKIWLIGSMVLFVFIGLVFSITLVEISTELSPLIVIFSSFFDFFNETTNFF